MNTRDHYELFRYLIEQHCLRPEDMVFVGDVAAWCAAQGIEEPDREKPLKIVPGDGACTVVIREDIPDRVLEERINALRVRGQTRNVAVDRGDLLNSARKKMAFLFLSEFAATLPDVAGDELAADDWALSEMERLGFFRA